MFLGILYRAGLWLTNKQRLRLIESVGSLLENFSSCADFAYECKLPRFKFQPKFHLVATPCNEISRGGAQALFTKSLLKDHSFEDWSEMEVGIGSRVVMGKCDSWRLLWPNHFWRLLGSVRLLMD